MGSELHWQDCLSHPSGSLDGPSLTGKHFSVSILKLFNYFTNFASFAGFWLGNYLESFTVSDDHSVGLYIYGCYFVSRVRAMSIFFLSKVV